MELKLTNEELQNPFKAIEDVFINYRLIELKTELEKIEKQVLENVHLNLKETLPYANTVHLFEKLDKLIQASYLLYQRNIEEHAARHN